MLLSSPSPVSPTPDSVSFDAIVLYFVYETKFDVLELA